MKRGFQYDQLNDNKAFCRNACDGPESNTRSEWNLLYLSWLWSKGAEDLSLTASSRSWRNSTWRLKLSWALKTQRTAQISEVSKPERRSADKNVGTIFSSIYRNYFELQTTLNLANGRYLNLLPEISAVVWWCYSIRGWADLFIEPEGWSAASIVSSHRHEWQRADLEISEWFVMTSTSC
jgi:hypothetical protein